MKIKKNTGMAVGCLLVIGFAVYTHAVHAEKRDAPASPGSGVSYGGNTSNSSSVSGGNHPNVSTVGGKTTVSGVGTMTGSGAKYSYAVSDGGSGNGNSNNNSGNGVSNKKKSATGYFDTTDSATCRVGGWAYDPDDQNVPIPVAVYRDNYSGLGGTYLTTCTADRPRSDVNTAKKISGDHGFNCALPASFQGTGSHKIYIHAMDINGTPNNALLTNGKSISCNPIPYCNLVASSTEITSGNKVDITWTSANTAGTATIRNGKDGTIWTVDPRNATGTRAATLSTTTRYTMTVQDSTGKTATCERLITVLPAVPAPDLIVTELATTKTCPLTDMTSSDICPKTEIAFKLQNIGNKSVSNIPYRVEQQKTDGSWTSIKTGSHSGTLGEGGVTTPLTVGIDSLPAGESTLRVVVNPDGGLGETNTGNNISNSISITYEKARVDLSFVYMDVTEKCAIEEMKDGVCPETKITFKIRNDGNKTISHGVVIPYIVQIYQGSVWTTVPTASNLEYSNTADLKLGDVTNLISISIPNLPFGTTKVRALVNLKEDGKTTLSTKYKEDNVTNNISELSSMVTYKYDDAIVTLELVKGGVSYGSSEVVRFDSTAELRYHVTADYQLTCAITGAFPAAVATSFTTPVGDTTNTLSSVGLRNTQSFTISCEPIAGPGVPSTVVTQSVLVEVVPQVQEI